MQGFEVLIPLVLFLTTGGVWGVFILSRHKERMNMIEKGMNAEDIKSLYQRQMLQVNPLSSLKWGIILSFVGVAIILGMWLRNYFLFDEGIFFGLIALLGGLGLVLFYFIASKRVQQ